MQLYIRGAWRTFTQRPATERGPDTEKSGALSIVTNDGTDASCYLFKGSSNRSSTSAPEIILTGNLLQLRSFYSAFASARPVMQEEGRCSILLENKQYLELIDETMADSGTSCQQPNVSVHCRRHYHRRTERPRNITSLESRGVRALLASYRRIRDLGIFPVQTFIDRDVVAMIFEDPDGNIVKVYAEDPEFLESFDMIAKDESLGIGDRCVHVEPEVLLERFKVWSADSRVSDARFKELIPVRVKSEPVVVE